MTGSIQLPVFYARILDMLRKKYLWGLVILYVMFIFGNSLQTGEVSGSLSRKIAEAAVQLLRLFNLKIGNFDLLHMVIRKLAHFSEFLILGLLVQWVNSRQPLVDNKLYVFLLFLLIGFTDEFLQLFVEGRAGMLTDSLIDSSGYVLSWIITMLVIKTHRSSR